MQEIDIAIDRGREEQVRDLVGEQAVDLLGHGAVEGAQSGFDMRHGDQQLGANQGRGDGGVDVAVDKYQIGIFGQSRLLEAHHDLSRLPGVRAGADFEIDVGLGQGELLEKYLGHVGVVVLAGVHQHLTDIHFLSKHLHHRRYFHKIWSGTDDVENFHN